MRDYGAFRRSMSVPGKKAANLERLVTGRAAPTVAWARRLRYEDLEESTDRGWRSPAAGHHRLRDCLPEPEKPGDGPDRKSAKTEPGFRGQRVGRNQAQDLREHRGQRHG